MLGTKLPKKLSQVVSIHNGSTYLGVGRVLVGGRGDKVFKLDSLVPIQD